MNDLPHLITNLLSGTPEQQSQTLSQYFLPNSSFTHPFCHVPAFSNPEFNLNSRDLILRILKWYRFLSPTTKLKIHSTLFDPSTNTAYIRTSQVFSIWFVPFHKTPPVNLVTVLTLEPVDGGKNDNQNRRNKGDANNNNDSNNQNGEAHYDAAAETRHLIQEGEKPSYTDVVEKGTNANAQLPDHDHDHDRYYDDRNASSRQPKHHDHHEQQKRGGQVSQNGRGSGKATTRYYIKHQEDLYQVNDFLKFLACAPGAQLYMLWQLFATAACVVLVTLLGPFMKVVAPRKWKGESIRVHEM